MDKAQLEQLRANSIADLSEQLPALEDAELKALRKIEEKSDDPRTGALKAIDDEIEKRAEAAKAKKAEAKVAAKFVEPPPSYQHPDYDGPLTGDQAMWRNRHLTKPASNTGTK